MHNGSRRATGLYRSVRTETAARHASGNGMLSRFSFVVAKQTRNMEELAPSQATLLVLAQRLFIANQLLNFPFYYTPGLRGLLAGDGSATKFPCSISWMTRKGLARLSTLAFWNVGWFFMLRAFAEVGSWLRFLFMLQMYAVGFVTVVLTPMMGPDVAMGNADALHCYSAMVYVFDHFVANELFLGISLRHPLGCAFALTSGLCGVFQALRADGDKLARQLHAARGRGLPFGLGRFDAFQLLLEYGFMLTENALFLIFLVGMSSGLSATQQFVPTSMALTTADGVIVLGIVAAVTVVEVHRARSAKAVPSQSKKAGIAAPSAAPAERRVSRRTARSPARASKSPPAMSARSRSRPRSTRQAKTD